MNQKISFGAIFALSVGVGTAIGVATGQTAVGVAMGAGLAPAIAALVRKMRSA